MVFYDDYMKSRRVINKDLDNVLIEYEGYFKTIAVKCEDFDGRFS